VEILFWLVPPVVVTSVAMLWVGWLGRARPTGPDRSDAAQERFAAAIQRDHPGEVRVRPRPAEHSTGVAVRASGGTRQPAPETADRPDTRRSA
jgi:hypothetical protein